MNLDDRTVIGLNGREPELGWRVLIRPAGLLTIREMVAPEHHDEPHIEFILEWGRHDVVEIFRAEDAYAIGEALMHHASKASGDEEA